MQTQIILVLAFPLGLLACNPTTPISDDGGSSDGSTPVDCPMPTAGPTMHAAGSLTMDESWSANGSPHIVLGDLTIPVGKTLNLEPCSVVQMGSGNYIYVHGTLTANGETTKPIAIEPKTMGVRWATLWVEDPGTAHLANVLFTGGGATPNQTAGATIRARGTFATGPTNTLFVDHVTIRDSAGYGVNLTETAQFAPGSQALIVTNSGKEDTNHPYPISINVQAMGSIPVGDYTGNGKDEIQIHADSPRALLDIDQTLHDRGVPYHVGGGGANPILNVSNDMGMATLTIEPNVTVKFEKDGRFNVGHYANNDPPHGVLVAVGRMDAPITFTSAVDPPSPGDWMGIAYSNTISPNNRLAFVHVDYAGGSCTCVIGCPPQNTNSDAAIIFYNTPPSGFITSSFISHSKMHGVDRAWLGAGPSFLNDITFTDVAQCNETDPRNSNNSCPAQPSCPK